MGAFDAFEKALEVVKMKSVALKDAEDKMNNARAEYDNSVIKAAELRAHIDEMLNTILPSGQGRIRVAS
jgi:hypothetical protein